MPALPDPLPTRFVAHLIATVTCTVEHTLLDDDRADVTETEVSFEAHVDGATVRVVRFPAISGEVDTAIGLVRAEVRVDGEPEGTYDPATGHAAVDAGLAFDPDSFLASTSRVTLLLATDARLKDPKATGNPLDAGDDRVVLVGEGTFDGGSIDGGRLGLAIACRIERVEAD